MTYKCPIWGTEAEQLANDAAEEGDKVRSPRTGGVYRISGTAKTTVQSLPPPKKARLTTWIVDQRRMGVAFPLVTDAVVQEANERRPLRMSERKDRFFLMAEARNLQPAQHLHVGGTVNADYHRDNGQVLAWTECANETEGYGLLALLHEEGYVTEGPKIRLRAKGFDRMEALSSGGASSNQAFVAMWFDPSMNDAYEHGLKPGIEDAGFRAFRIDKKEHTNKVDDEIIAEIKRSRFLVADFTCGTTSKGKTAIARGGVYYEAGFAHGLRIPTIFCCRSDCITLVHFDTRQFNHIVWEDPAGLRSQLTNRIRAVIS